MWKIQEREGVWHMEVDNATAWFVAHNLLFRLFSSSTGPREMLKARYRKNSSYPK